MFSDAAAMAVEFFQKRSFSFGGFLIGLKIGLSHGEVEWGIAYHATYGFYFKGAPIDQSAACQDKAKDKNYPIVLDNPALLRLTDLALDATEFEPGFSLGPAIFQPSGQTERDRAASAATGSHAELFASGGRRISTTGSFARWSLCSSPLTGSRSAASSTA